MNYIYERVFAGLWTVGWGWTAWLCLLNLVADRHDYFEVKWDSAGIVISLAAMVFGIVGLIEIKKPPSN